MNFILLPMLFWMAVSNPGESGSLVEQAFKVSTQNVEVKKFTDSSIQLKSENNSYVIKLEPNREGNVAFSVTGIGYMATYNFRDLQFGIRITGYRADEEVFPTFNMDGNNEDIRLEHNTMIFQQIHGSVPVWFHEPVDSIKLIYENSLMADVQQYLRIEDLKIISQQDVSQNPGMSACEKQHIMVAIDGSSSILPEERRRIAKQFLRIVRHSQMARDSNSFTVLEFGSDVLSEKSLDSKKDLIRTLKEYKKMKRWKNRQVSWTNWSAAFEAAIEQRPDLFIFVTDGWSNFYNSRPASFTAQYENLFVQTNQIKNNGTRILFIASKMDEGHEAQTVLKQYLNGENTRHVAIDEATMQAVDVGQADLVKLSTFADLEKINFATVLRCSGEKLPLAGVEKQEANHPEFSEE